MKTPLFILALCCCLCVSCRTQRSLTQKTKALSHQLGFKVSRHDDLSLFTEAANWLGTPYRYGGNTPKGVDCSGLVKNMYQQVYGITLPRTTSAIASEKCRRISKSNLQSGDLVFFNTSGKRKGINHTGIFLKKEYFIHASTSKGVIISSLKEKYYRKAWKQGGKVKR